MGQKLSTFFDMFTGKKDARIVMVGLDAAGKTTVLYKLKLNDVVTTSRPSVSTWNALNTRTSA